LYNYLDILELQRQNRLHLKFDCHQGCNPHRHRHRQYLLIHLFQCNNRLHRHHQLQFHYLLALYCHLHRHRHLLLKLPCQ
jgi:hypothetical protein